MAARIKGTYGVDAPYVPVILAIVAVVAFVLAALTASSGGWVGWIVIGVLFLLQTALYLNTTFRGKFAIWSRLIDGLELRGTESTLDVGCGRGMALITTALRLTSGRATGIDLWRSRDQSGNDPDRTRANASANGVADRIDVETADMTDLPMADATFDVVTANVAIQNIKNRELRRAAIGEMYRVAKAGGHLVIVDIQYTKEYRDDLEALGAQDVAIRGLGPSGWFGNPFVASKLVAARKP